MSFSKQIRPKSYINHAETSVASISNMIRNFLIQILIFSSFLTLCNRCTVKILSFNKKQMFFAFILLNYFCIPITFHNYLIGCFLTLVQFKHILLENCIFLIQKLVSIRFLKVFMYLSVFVQL